MSERVLVVGANAAGMTAASRAKRLDPRLEITVIDAGEFISYSICGLPYYLSGIVSEHSDLIRFTPEALEQQRGIRARTGLRADLVMAGKRALACTSLADGRSHELGFDRLVISTGYLPRHPEIEGTDLQGVLTVSRLEDGLRIRRAIDTGRCGRVAIVGGGYVGLMMAHGLRERGLEVVLFEQNAHLFDQIDGDMAELVEDELRRAGVELHLETRAERLVGRDGVFVAVQAGRERIEADLALIDVGILPNTRLAEESGLALGISGAVQVDERGMTSQPGIYAAGNCAETFHRVSGRPIFSGLGTSAARQGRVVGENLAGRRSAFPGTLETSIERVFELGISRTGLTSKQAWQHGFECDSVRIRSRDRAGYYPGSRPMDVKLIFERRSGRVLGGQIVSAPQAAKRIDTLVAALSSGMKLRDLAQLDLAYAPPMGTLWDPIQVAANVGLRKLD